MRRRILGEKFAFFGIFVIMGVCWSSLVAMTRDCKSLGFGLRRFESYLQHHLGRCRLSSVVEHFHGKEGVSGSSPEDGSRSARSAIFVWADLLGFHKKSKKVAKKACIFILLVYNRE